MPAIKTHLLISAALAAALLSGCQTNTAALDPSISAPNVVADPDLALSAEADIPLPDTVEVVPTSYASTEAAPAGAVLAVATETPGVTGTPAAEAPVTVADAADAAVAPAAAVAKQAVSPLSAPMAGGEVAEAALAVKLTGEFPPAPTITMLPATAPVPASYQVASLGNVPPMASSFAAPDSPARASSAAVDQLISKYAALYEVPEGLVRRVVKRESNFFSGAYNRGHWGLMQIKHATARGMGYDGPANGLLDAETNLKYAVKYLRGAWLVADGDENQADRLYQSGYYFHAKRKGLLDETGLGRDRVRHRG